MIQQEEKKGNEQENIASILSQSAVEPIYSGASIIKEIQIEDIIEGVKGKGDLFMIGQDFGSIPQEVKKLVIKEHNKMQNNCIEYFLEIPVT